jgi:hypothetical protein
VADRLRLDSKLYSFAMPLEIMSQQTRLLFWAGPLQPACGQLVHPHLPRVKAND